MQCLNCGAEMMRNTVSTHADRVVYDLCERCGSLWLDAGELDKMAFRVQGSIEASSTEPLADPETEVKPCPRCDHAHLYRVHFLDVTEIVLRRCRNCGGFWLDGGQLDALDRELEADMPVSGRGFADFVHNVQVPYWYSRVQRRSGEVEKPLEAPPIPGAQRGRDTEMTCPACGRKLAEYAAYHMKFEGCPACKGVFLDPAELRRLKNKVGNGEPPRWLNEEINSLERASAIETQRRCPHCPETKLVAAIFGKSGLVMDWCPRCRWIWLDADEFSEMLQYLQSERRGMSARQIEALAGRELKAVVTGGGEGRLEELGDAWAAVGALVSATIFEHPTLARILLGAPRI